MILSLGRRTVLLANVHSSSDGHGVGYGMTLIRMRKAFMLGRMLPAAVFLVPSRRAINAAVTELESDDITIVPSRGWPAAWLRVIWAVSAPWRVSSPALWTGRAVSRFITGTCYDWLERSTWLPPRVRRAVLGRRETYRRLKAFNTQYASRAEKMWQERYRRHVLVPFRELEDTDQRIPVVRFRLPRDREDALTAEASRLGIALQAQHVTIHDRDAG